jgi:hypothetical protein
VHSIIGDSRRFRRREGILQQDVSGAVVLFNMENGRYYSLNDVGARAWELCDGARSLSAIVAVLSGEYAEAEATVHEDVVNLFSELSDEQLLLEAHPAS